MHAQGRVSRLTLDRRNLRYSCGSIGPEAAVTFVFAPGKQQRANRRRGAATVAMLVAIGACLSVTPAEAQCSPRAVLQNYARLKPVPQPAAPDITSAASTPVWKTISVGTTRSTLALRNALDAARCGLGDLAEQILA